MLANFPLLLHNLQDGFLWLVKGVRIEPAHVGIAAVCFLILWIATTRHEPTEPPQGPSSR